PGVPGFQVEERLERRIGDAQRLDAVLVDRHEAHRHPMAGVPELAVEVAPQDFTVLKADGDLLSGTRLLLRARWPGDEGDALDRRQRDEGALIVAPLVGHLELDV